MSREGRNFEEILAEADEQDCDLVSLGRLGLGIVPTSSIGSVAERVARRAKQDVLIAGTTDNEGPILAAIDGSPASFAGLKTALELSKVFNRPIEAVAAFDPIFHQSAFRSIAGVLTEEAGRLFRFNEQEKLHEEIIDKGLARIYKGHLDTAESVASSSGMRIKTTLLSGKASDEIIKYAKKISAFMVVFGRTGAQATPKLDIGSTAENCMRELACHVLISSGEFIPENAHAPSDPSAIDWTDEAKAILERIPKFARTIVRNMVEDSARQKGLTIVSASFMREVRKRMEGQVSLQPPYLISWNLTNRCNLACGHCYLDAAELTGNDATSASEALRVTGDIASFAPGAMLVLTGGEPLLRPDIFDIISLASTLGLNPVIGTNGTMLNDEVCSRLLHAGIKGAGVSLDSITPPFHDKFRGMEGAWQKTIDGIDALRRASIPFQLQFTVTKENRDEIDRAVTFAIERGALSINFFFLVCTGRGQKATDLTPQEYETVLEEIVKAEEKFSGQILVRARCAPHIVRVAEKLNPESPLVRGATAGCIAAKGYLRISPEGFVTACPYIPANADSPSALKTSLKDIWEQDPSFSSLRESVLTAAALNAATKTRAEAAGQGRSPQKGASWKKTPCALTSPKRMKKERRRSKPPQHGVLRRKRALRRSPRSCAR